MKGFGVFLILLGIIGLVASLGMDTSVETGFGRVNNLGLMQERQNFIMIACLVIGIGTLMAIFGKSADSITERSDPFDQLERHAQLVQKPQHPHRAGLRHVMQGDHRQTPSGSFGRVALATSQVPAQAAHVASAGRPDNISPPSGAMRK